MTVVPQCTQSRSGGGPRGWCKTNLVILWNSKLRVRTFGTEPKVDWWCITVVKFKFYYFCLISGVARPHSLLFISALLEMVEPRSKKELNLKKTDSWIINRIGATSIHPWTEHTIVLKVHKSGQTILNIPYLALATSEVSKDPSIVFIGSSYPSGPILGLLHCFRLELLVRTYTQTYAIV